ncbi:MAG: hypothetical protein JWQ25_2203, partial [Daejeonella sp.]|nr:hypothetical protein [Daejeonella sp.]
KREFVEECNAEIEIIEHFYTTDFFNKSAFNESQIISVYYLVKPVSKLNLNFKHLTYDFVIQAEVMQSFRWKSITELTMDDVTFPTDKKAVEILTDKWKKNLLPNVTRQ